MLPPGLTCMHPMHLMVPHLALALQVQYRDLMPEGYDPLSFIIFVPTILCIVELFRTSIEKTFLNVYLPVVLLLPEYFHIKLPALPPIDFSEAVAVPLGLALVYRMWRTYRPSITDAAVLLFILSTGMFHFQHGNSSHGTFNMFLRTFEGLVPYLLGKLLIESRDIRLATVRRIVVLTAAGCVLALSEYFFKSNPYARGWQHFFPDQPLSWETQIRWGFGRVAGPYGQSELAGMILLIGIVFALWAGIAYPWKGKFANIHHPLDKRTVVLAILAVTLFATQARGPWLGALLAVPVALLGLTRHLLRNALVLVTVCAVAGVALYVNGKRYTAANPSTDEQQTAQYRAQLIDAYIPIARQGGPWGWGEAFPIVKTADSIDNEYLFVWLVQGSVGMATFVFISLATVVHLIWSIARATGKRDRFFALTLLGAFSGILLTAGTVFLYGQPFQFFFLLAGWAQSVKTARTASTSEDRHFAFAHALT